MSLVKKTRAKPRFVVPERTCFVMMPFGPESNDRYEKLYLPSISDAGMLPRRADSLSRPSPIMEDIWQGIKEATMLLADLTDRNANVFYELGLAHGICKPAVLITDRIEDVPFDLRALRLLVYKRSGANPGFRKKLARALCETEEHSSSALPAAIAAAPRAFERVYALGGRSVGRREFEHVSKSLKDVPASRVEAALKRAVGRLSSNAQERLFGEVFWEESRRKYASQKVTNDLRSRMASMGRNFPDCLLAEVMYALYSGSEHITIHVLVETGFARDLVEGNIIFDVVEWAMGQAGL